MKEIFYNEDKLEEKDIDEVVVRVKAIIINDGKILLCKNHNSYQFPGGHVDKNEEYNKALERELLEETGGLYHVLEKPIYKIRYYCKNYRNTLKNRENIIYYYVLRNKFKINMNNINLTEYEKEGDFIVDYYDLKEIDKLFKDTIELDNINKFIYKEMKLVLEDINE